MIDKKLIQAVQRGRDAYFLMEKFGIPQATAFRLVKRIRSGQLERKHGSGQPSCYVWDVQDTRRFLLDGPLKSSSTDGNLWTVRSIRTSLKTLLGLPVSLDTIRRRLSRSGLKPHFPAPFHKRLLQHGESSTRRPTCFFIGQMEINLHILATNRRSDNGSTERLQALYALDRRKKILFRCYDREATSRDLIDFLNNLIACHPNRLIVGGTELSLYGLAGFLKQSRSNLLILKLAGLD